MALIQCDECGHLYSDSLSDCPECGCPRRNYFFPWKYSFKDESIIELCGTIHAIICSVIGALCVLCRIIARASNNLEEIKNNTARESVEG